MRHVLLCGTSTRAAAASAARAGYEVTALDAFADLDQAPGVRALSLPRDFGSRFTAAAAARVSREIGCDAVAYLSPFENHPRAVSTLARGRVLLGNPPAVLRRVRDPVVLAATLRACGFQVPAVNGQDPAFVRNGANAWNDPDGSNDPNGSFPWVLKPFRSGGGRGVRPWPGGRVPRGCYLQQRVDGTPGSVVFLAGDGDVVPIAISRQLVGDARFGATGYRYCGSIVAAAGDAGADGGALAAAASALAGAVTREFGLVGVNGIDFVAREGVPSIVEVNPRWSASMELADRICRAPLFAAHAHACRYGLAGAPDVAINPDRAFGRAVVFARRAVAMRDTRPWLDDPDMCDVPRAGEQFEPGQPVCTVLAEAPDAQACYDALVARAARVYDTLEGALTLAPV